jgi:hypothetical protein
MKDENTRLQRTYMALYKSSEAPEDQISNWNHILRLRSERGKIEFKIYSLQEKNYKSCHYPIDDVFRLKMLLEKNEKV